MIAALAAGIGAVLSFVGLIHADKVEWAAAPQVALGYALLAVVLVLISLIQRNQPAVPMTEPESVGVPDGEPVPVTEHPGTEPATNQTAAAPDPATV